MMRYYIYVQYWKRFLRLVRSFHWATSNVLLFKSDFGDTFKMRDYNLYEMLSARNGSGGTYFHEACQANSIALLWRAAGMLDESHPRILNIRDYKGAQCTHIIATSNVSCSIDMMNIVLQLGADINGQEGLAGLTPLHICVNKKNYALAEWLCQAPGIDVKVENFGKETPYDLACKMEDRKMMKIFEERSKKM
ncbi:viral ankyrin [Bracoviriform demolitoris]|uniref:I-Kappa-B like protein H1 n=1 Tax=Microplitis demolitor bracovirus (isolate Webb) TaxID=654919 RepID=IKBH1_MDBVW|nr:NF-kappa-B inhibitor cactus [Microplitis demolitor]YP_239384.1 viral ankyrin [Bracoviriform demolitoris]Q5I144.1 RecName: Full=I-Kappa-B like protein H1 [Microplitis demolitor bracovirus (isolate Webb)]AAW51789.1 viral ankyrin [Bracoviriform demolitoris]KAG6558443.1 viral ankyrin H4 [Microplitis demolitor]